MTSKELENLYLMTEYGVFTPNYTYDDYIIKYDEKTGDIIKEEYTNLVVHKTAQEVYEEWLQNNYKLIDGEWVKKEQIDICPGKTVEERLLEAEIENKKLKQHQEFIEECLMEMAQIVYS